MEQHTPQKSSAQKQRKSLDDLSPKEYQLYFFAARLLLIFPPNQQDKRPFIFRYGGASKEIFQNYSSTVYPKCMHDSLVSMHASSCEHGTESFPYWHRWLFTKFEEYLLKSHQNVLSPDLITTHSNRLGELARKINKEVTNEQISKLLVQIQKDYTDLIAGQNITFIPAHYWNVFKPGQEINFPKGFISKQAYYSQRYIAIDNLIRLVWNQDSIYEINITTRYDFPVLNKYYRREPYQYKEMKHLMANYSFWAQPQKFPAQIQFAYQFIKNKYSDYLRYEQHLKRISSDGFQNLNLLRFNVFDTNILNYVFGGKGFTFYPNARSPKSTSVSVFKQTRNDKIGYYTYCRSLQTRPQDFFQKFCTTAGGSNFSMENPHNQMHNDQVYLMNDSAFSIVNPIFFAYHGLIDLMLDHKIDILKRNQYDENTAASNVQSYMNRALTIHYDPNTNRGEYNRTFKSNWQTLFYKTNGRYPNNSDYPITKWISSNARNTNDIITQNDFQQEEKFNYQKLILKYQNNAVVGLNSSLQFVNVGYQKTTFQNTINSILPSVPGPYSQSGLYVALQARHKSSIRSTNLVVQLRNMNGKILSTKTEPIFSKGLAAQDCPNCQEYISRTVLFPVEEFQQEFKNFKNIRNNGEFAFQSFSEVQSRINFASSLSYSLSTNQVAARFVTGRKNLKITVINPEESQKEVKVYLRSEQTQRTNERANEIKRIKKPIVFNQKRQNQQQVSSNNQFNILGVQAQVDGKTIRYDFPFYSDKSEVVFNFGKEQKFGLSKKARIGQPLNNVYERTDQIEIQAQKGQGFIQERAIMRSTNPKLQRMVLTEQDYE